jgi:hypothetical protein
MYEAARPAMASANLSQRGTCLPTLRRPERAVVFSHFEERIFLFSYPTISLFKINKERKFFQKEYSLLKSTKPVKSRIFLPALLT